MSAADLSSLRGRHIVLGISGGIAAYKSAVLVRCLVKAGAEVQVIMTPSAREFITPVTLSTLSGHAVITEFFTANTGEWHSHVDLGLWADAFVVAPATACTLAKMATGVADNMLVTSYLATRAKVFVAPAMDLDMMAHPSTTANLDTLRSRGVDIIEPAEGELASHLRGRGRMEEPEAIAAALARHFATAGSMAGRHVMITAGPTRECIDPVRYIGNFSTGKMGYALAAEAARRGARVTLVSGPVSEPVPAGVDVVRVESALEMLDAATGAAAEADICIFSAAVADYRPAHPLAQKAKRESAERDITSVELVKNPDIAATLGAARRPGQVMVGFALETDHEAEAATAKLVRKHLDMIVLNSLRDPGAGFGTDTNKVTMYFADGRTPVATPLKSKADIAADILTQTISLT
ncbi:MAG: bifunctional phosphopantothenoylcysteine decarboxylase/phosphopantothenate--cysteine ligase CoaBC [Bacteroides sp.]|nr:bifunctional phosphopantothenoylcysteine decarboxylase/phosphopantothenate--cysteine ligase CoaBC [Bacteroides sp.]MCM1095347.1 bifunctional phosphopantothenoylcysteine decarboxylase/phosphopantothenate--cysteine ligase CoaBC [Terasakiella sp.]